MNIEMLAMASRSGEQILSVPIFKQLLVHPLHLAV